MLIMHPERQGGFALISAIFILVVLAALGGFIATVSTTQHIGSALDVMSARAYQAAHAGTEWGLATVLKGAPVKPGDTTTCSTTVPSPVIAIDGMTVSVCLKLKASSAVVGVGPSEPSIGEIWEVTAVACNMPTGSPTACPIDGTANPNAVSPNYVERRLTVLTEK